MIFNPDLHEYRDNGAVIPSVTQILTRAGIIDDRWYTRESCERGSAVHDFCAQYAIGIRYDKLGRALDSLEYVNAFSSWIEDHSAYALHTECLVEGNIVGNRYAGTFDLLLLMNGKRVLIDIKTGTRAKWHPTQLAAYSLARFENGERVNPDICMNLYLQPNGKYKENYITGIELVKAIDEFKKAITEALTEKEKTI